MTVPNLTVLDAEPPGEGIIAYLEELLEEAKRGELSSIAFAKVLRDGSTASGWSNAPSLPVLVGAIAALQARVVQEMIGE